jgi:two-component system response regulator AgrA
MKIYICEDDKMQRRIMETIISDYLMRENYDISIEQSVGSPIELLNHVAKHPNKEGLYFLDVDLRHKMSGIQLAVEIRKRDERGTIVFVTAHAELSFLTFLHKIEAMDYVVKNNVDDMAKKIQECISVAYERRLKTITQRMYQVKSGTRVHQIPFQEIMFFETAATSPGNKRVVLHTKSKRLEFYGVLGQIENSHQTFFRCHNAYLVNVRNIESVCSKTKQVKMVDGSTVFVSARKMKELVERVGK